MVGSREIERRKIGDNHVKKKERKNLYFAVQERKKMWLQLKLKVRSIQEGMIVRFHVDGNDPVDGKAVE